MKHKAIVIYKSCTGFTKQYAKIIAESLSCPLADFREAKAELLSGYDIVIFGSRAHAGRIDGYQKARELFQKSGAKTMILFVTGATPNEEKDVIRQFFSQNLSADEMKKIPHFYMQSGLRYENMGAGDRLMMKAASFMMKKKKDKDPYEKAFERALAGSYDISSPEYVKPLVEFVRGQDIL